MASRFIQILRLLKSNNIPKNTIIRNGPKYNTTQYRQSSSFFSSTNRTSMASKLSQPKSNVLKSSNSMYSQSRCDCDHKKKKPEKQSFWSKMFKKKPKPPPETCRLRGCNVQIEKTQKLLTKVEQHLPRSNVELTCGQAVIVHLPSKVKHRHKNRLQLLQEIIEKQKPTMVQETICDPMPEFTTVGKRLIDLQERKLHPMYKKYMETPVPCKMKPCARTHLYMQTLQTTEDKFKFERDMPGKQYNFRSFKMAPSPKNFPNRKIINLDDDNSPYDLRKLECTGMKECISKSRHRC